MFGRNVSKLKMVNLNLEFRDLDEFTDQRVMI